MDMVAFERDWFLTFNMSMVAFSATLIVHINCWINSIRVVKRGGDSGWLRKWNLFQASCAVSCHLCRISDYFFKTDCNVKGFYNFFSYYSAILSMDSMAAYMATTILLALVVKRRPTLLMCFTLFLIPFVAKWFVLIRAVIHLTNSVMDLNMCMSGFIPGIFESMMFTEVGCHCFTFLLYGALLGHYLNSHPTTYTKENLFTLDLKDRGLIFLMFMDIITISLFTPVGVGNAGPNPEILVQIRWALTSKCFNIALLRFLKSSPPTEKGVSLKSTCSTNHFVSKLSA